MATRPRAVSLVWLDVFAVGAQALVFVPMALFRFLDGDEGVYAYSARLAVHGELPYRDFFYEQMPLMPWVYGAWTAIGGESWRATRLLSALLAIAIGGVVYLLATRRLGRPAGLAALGIYSLSALVFGYFPILKTLVLSTLFLVLALALVEAGRWLPAGLLVGLAVDTRLVFVVAVPAMAYAAWRRRRVSRLAAGLGLGLLPSVVLLALAPRPFLFDNLGYHAGKSSGGLVGDFPQKVRTGANLVGFGSTDKAIGLQMALLFLAVLVGVLAVLPRRRRPSLAAGLAASLVIGCLLPTPTYVQYFSVAVPFLVLTAVELLPAVRGRRAAAAVVLGLAAYAGAAAVGLRRDTETEALLRPSIASVERVSAAVEARTAPGERVLSSWPGYLYGTHAEAFAGYTNHFGPAAALEVGPVRARRYRLLSEPAIEQLIRGRVPRLVVYRNWLPGEPRPHWDQALAAAGYRLVAEVETARIYRR